MQRDATGHEPGRCGVALLTIALLGLMGAGTPIQAQTRNDALTSAAIDPTIYRDGEVRRFSSVHGNWRIVCDEVTRLHQRFCSMRSLIAQTDGSVVAELTISTGQDGRPAALLKITDALVRDGTLDVVVPPDAAPPSTAKTAAAIRKSTPQKGRTPPPRSVTRLTAVTCDRRLCTLIWTLRPEQIAALNDGRGLEFIAGAGMDPAKPETLNFKAPMPAHLTVSAQGFSEAVAASVKPFD